MWKKIYNLANGKKKEIKERNKKFNIELGRNKSFPFFQIYISSIKKLLYQLLTLETILFHKL